MNEKANSSGGIGIFIKSSLLEEFDYSCNYVDQDKVIGIKLVNKRKSETLVVYCVYLPPSTSHYGNVNKQVLNKLIIEVYKESEADMVMICGDFNARVGTKSDCPMDMGIPSRIVIDEIQNKQGELMLSFINDIKACIVNGGVSSEHDDFTSIDSHKGNAVVDYHIVRQTDLKLVKKMAVVSALAVVDNSGSKKLISDWSRMPDHSLLCMEIELVTVLTESVQGNTLGSKSAHRSQVKRKVGDNYINSDLAARLIPELIEDWERLNQTQAEMDDRYSKFMSFVLEEAVESTIKVPKK